MAEDYEIASVLSYYGRLKFPVLVAGVTDPAAIWPLFADVPGANAVGVTYASYPWNRCFLRSEEMAPEAAG